MSNAETAYQALLRFDRWAKSTKNPYYKGIRFGRRVGAKALLEAELTFGVALPDGYVRLLEEHGPASFVVQPKQEDGYFGTHDILPPADFEDARARIFPGNEGQRGSRDPARDFRNHIVFQYIRDEDEGDGYTFYRSSSGKPRIDGIYASYHDEGAAARIADDFDQHVTNMVNTLLGEMQERLAAWNRKLPGNLKKVTPKRFFAEYDLKKEGGPSSSDIRKCFVGKGRVSVDDLAVESDTAVLVHGDLEVLKELYVEGLLVVRGNITANRAFLCKHVRAGGTISADRMLWIGGYCSSLHASGLRAPVAVLDWYGVELAAASSVELPLVLDNTTFKGPPPLNVHHRIPLQNVAVAEVMDGGKIHLHKLRQHMKAGKPILHAGPR
jgi:hypothetical protein